jgi:hypothetical protein
MVPRTARNRSGTLYEGYLCLGRRQDPTSCTMPPVLRADVDTAVYRYFEQVGLDVEATPEQLTAAVEHKREKSKPCATPPSGRRSRPLSAWRG